MMHALTVTLLLGACMIVACSKRSPSYESRFNDEIWIEFPSGHQEGDFVTAKQHIDQRLRTSNAGFFSGLMGGSNGIDFITIDTDFDVIDEHAFVASLIQDGMVPKGIKAEYHRN